jgi:hypothetical protein
VRGDRLEQMLATREGLSVEHAVVSVIFRDWIDLGRGEKFDFLLWMIMLTLEKSCLNCVLHNSCAWVEVRTCQGGLVKMLVRF